LLNQITFDIINIFIYRSVATTLTQILSFVNLQKNNTKKNYILKEEFFYFSIQSVYYTLLLHKEITFKITF